MNESRSMDKNVTAQKVLWKPGNMLYPVPVVMVSCKRKDEKPNIITVAWAGTVCSSPAMLSISVRPERYSYGIIKETKEFVVNLVTKELLRATDLCGVKSGRDVDKFAEARLTPQDMEHVDVPGIAESPVNLECRVVSVKHLGSHDMFLAEVVGVMVDGKYLDEEGKFHLNSAGLVTYSHGEYYALGKKLGTFGYSVKRGSSAKKQTQSGWKKPEKLKPGVDKSGNAADKKEKGGKAAGRAEKTGKPYGKTEKPEKPYGRTEKTGNSYGKTEKPEKPYGKTEKTGKSYGRTEKTGKSYGKTEKTGKSYGKTEKTGKPYGRTEKTGKPARNKNIQN